MIFVQIHLEWVNISYILNFIYFNSHRLLEWKTYTSPVPFFRFLHRDSIFYGYHILLTMVFSSILSDSVFLEIFTCIYKKKKNHTYSSFLPSNKPIHVPHLQEFSLGKVEQSNIYQSFQGPDSKATGVEGLEILFYFYVKYLYFPEWMSLYHKDVLSTENTERIRSCRIVVMDGMRCNVESRNWSYVLGNSSGCP